MMRYTLTAFVTLLGLLASLQAAAQGWQWAKGNTGAGLDAWAVATDKSGNVFAGGYKTMNGNVIFDGVTVPSPGVLTTDFQCIIAKYNSNGAFLWARGVNKGSSTLIGLATDASGNVYMFGSMTTPTVEISGVMLYNAYDLDAQYFLAKYDPNGNLLWAKNAGNVQKYFVTVGDISFVLGLGAIAVDPSGNACITANFHKPTITIGSYTLTNSDATGNSDDIFIAKYDPDGNVLWATSAGDVGKDDAYAITTTPAGDIYIAGDFSSPSLTFGASVITNTAAAKVAFIARYNSSGTPKWAAASGGTGKEYAAGLAADVAGNVYLVGGVKDASISYSGETITNPYPGKPVLYLVKFDQSDAVSWHKVVFSPTGGEAYGYSVATSTCGDVWVCGAMSLPKTDTTVSNPGIVNIDGRLLTALPQSYDPMFIAGYTSSGMYIGASALLSGADDQSTIACDAVGNVFLCSDYVSKSPFNLAGRNFPVDSITDELLYVAKYAPRSAQHFHKSDTEMCFVNNITLNAPTGHTSYLWNDGYRGPQKPITDTGIFWVWSYDSCDAQYIDTFTLKTICDCSKYFFVPNTFTPNGDGQNDFFYPRSGLGQTRVSSFRVYNRWGAVVFERDNIMANDISNAWDGTYLGNKALPDVYVFVVSAVCENGTVINKKGSVTIVR